MLNVQAGSDTKSIKCAVRKLVVKIHPDKCDLPGAEEAFKAVLAAAEHVSSNASGDPLSPSYAAAPAAGWVGLYSSSSCRKCTPCVCCE